MKVLHVYKTYLPDNFRGIPRSIWEIAEATKSHGVTSEVLSVSETPVPASLPVGTHISHRARQDAFIASTGLSLSVFGRFRELAADADILHYHFPWPLMDLLHLATRPKRPAIVTYHSDIIRQKVLRIAYAPLMHAFLNRVDGIVATSPNYAESSKVLRRYRSKVSVIPLGLGDRVSSAEDVIERWRKRFPEPFLLFVGALRYYKGLNFLVRAARSSGVPLVVVGAGEMSAELERDRPPNMLLLGELGDADKDALIDLCHAFVFPSHLRSEAFGLALLEAARAGKPMISCEVGSGTSYINAHGQTGYVIASGDASALASAMTQMMTIAPVRAMGAAARQRYEALFTERGMGNAYVRLYRAVLADRLSQP